MLRSLENAPIDHPLETGLNLFGGTVASIDDLRAPFLDTHYAVRLMNNPPRFHGDLWDDVAKFKELLGPDVDPLQHGPYQARTVAIPAIDLQAEAQASGYPQINEMMARYFVAHHVIHDDHEGVTGDVLFPAKTPEIKEAEFEVWKQVVTDVYGEDRVAGLRYFGNVFERGHETTLAARLWDVSERLGYMATGERAFELAINEPGLSFEERQRSLTMATRVMNIHAPAVEANRSTIAIADDWLTRLGPIIKEARENER